MESLWEKINHVDLFHVIAGFQKEADIARERSRIARDIDDPLDPERRQQLCGFCSQAGPGGSTTTKSGCMLMHRGRNPSAVLSMGTTFLTALACRSLADMGADSTAKTWSKRLERWVANSPTPAYKSMAILP